MKIKSCHSLEKGFTLVELILVFTIFFITTTVGMIAFSKYTTSQALDSSAADVATFLQTTKTYAASQSMLGGCSSGLQRYSVKFTPPSAYEMFVYCGSSVSIKKQTLPTDISFDTTTSSEISFTAGNGLSSGGTVKIKNSTNTENIQVDPAGNVTIQ